MPVQASTITTGSSSSNGGVSSSSSAKMPRPRTSLCIDDYDCVGFDLDHTLCRYNVGPMIRLEYDLLAEFLVTKKGYDPAIRARTFDQDQDFVCKGLTLDCERGNLLRLASDGWVVDCKCN